MTTAETRTIGNIFPIAILLSPAPLSSSSPVLALSGFSSIGYFFELVVLVDFFAVCFLGLPDNFLGFGASTGSSQYGPRGVSFFTAPSTLPLFNTACAPNCATKDEGSTTPAPRTAPTPTQAEIRAQQEYIQSIWREAEQRKAAGT